MATPYFWVTILKTKIPVFKNNVRRDFLALGCNRKLFLVRGKKNLDIAAVECRLVVTLLVHCLNVSIGKQNVSVEARRSSQQGLGLRQRDH